MQKELKKFEAVIAEWIGWEGRIVTITFRVENEKDALEIAEDMALLEGTELICLSRC
jgi:hypothetical protein